MNYFKVFSLLLLISFVWSCAVENKSSIIVVKNSIDQPRNFETVELSAGLLKVDDLKTIGILDKETNKLQITQLVDKDGNGTMDFILFQPKIEPNSEKQFEIVTISEEDRPKTELNCFSRFVPERTDDYAWENDKVAFRVFGPTAQKMNEDGVNGGTLSSGVDAWLKKVDYPIINKWYKANDEKVGSYHIDHGEGLDNFHVGASRGVGGLAIKKDSTYYFSKNYTKWRTITTGPIRTSFYLEIGNWDAGGNLIKESKIISLDYGSNLSKFEITIDGTNQVSAGLTLHEKDGIVSGNKNEGWVSYWQPHGDSELGTAIVSASVFFKDYTKYETEKTDLSNAYVDLNVLNNKTIYYAGFAWKEWSEYKNQDDWETYLQNFSKKLNNPLTIKYIIAGMQMSGSSSSK